ncbi:hypothetical protein WME76_47260 (plasmid) [Sorangium sp. So ce119]|uniref:hypothetical protein n=1 Tax=Sorangium sp. So ce119 TaxID=3133279 RepID=UPI003F6403BD
MTRMLKGLGVFAAVGGLFVTGISGCNMPAGDDAELGSLSLPLAAQAPSGVSYRLRNATFQIQSDYYWYDGVSVGSSSSGVGGSPGSTTSSSTGYFPGGTSLTINSEDEDPDASSILVDLEQGSYYVQLLPGWHLEKVEGGTATAVDATLLSSQMIYVYVSPHSTTWAQYQFGIGDRALWLNGKLNLSINVYEDPDEYYGYGQGGAGGGDWGTGGAGGAIAVSVGSSGVGVGGGGGF